MTVAISAPVSAPFIAVPLSVQANRFREELADGAVAVDLRDAASHRRFGALLGAVAVNSDEALDLLSPESPSALRAATLDARWVLVSEDGYDAEWLAWHLQARGVTGTRFVVGGHRALREHGVTGSVGADALGLYDPR
ncbi:rhodanese-like domain-containing protein [Gordonia sp. HY002]|uniref:rhodanese-like domain-containing protein n=1 Tax=Gordonia zhenghanii TaxID=2911516 RepID=UPI001EF08602|nr:rhodanese-like domain-containing protein [Gordonia zhenghanii]MCF8571132.1 rhodanese-like domain-containing protein [Gordonia zhenghanii]MCF8604660.1 rhodanese-like domain-containing protein [Gordonia zhenghanii]